MMIDEVGKPWYVLGAGSLLDDLRRAGVRYVAISEPSYDRYISPFTKAEPGFESEFQRHRTFYATLLNQCVPVWQSEQRYPNHSFVNPILRLYDLSEKKPASRRGG